MNKNKKGSILAYSLIIISMMLAIATSFSVSTIIEKKSASSTDSSVQALQTADGGMKLTIQRINNELREDRSNLIRDISEFSASCDDSSGIATIKNLEDAGTDSGKYSLSFYNESGGAINNCGSLLTAIKVIKSVGVFNNTVRVVSATVAE